MPRPRSASVLVAVLATLAVLAVPLALSQGAATAARGVVVHTADSAGTPDPEVNGDPRVAPFARPLAGDGVLPSRGWIKKWPGRTIPYWVKLPDKFMWSFRAAIRAWNDTGLDMTFKQVPKSKARLRIFVGDTGGSDGLATVGYQGSNWVHLSSGLLNAIPTASQAYVRVVAAHIITHELGHNLGLEHTDGCHLMTPILYLPDCPMMADRIGYYACRVVDAQALDRTVNLYGGTRRLAAKACPLDPAPQALSGVDFAGGLAADKPIAITWNPPSNPPPGGKVDVLIAPGATCNFPIVKDYWGEATYSDNVRVLRVDPAAGVWHQNITYVDTNCYGVQPVNESGAGPSPVTHTLTSWVQAPAPPTVEVVRRALGSPGDYFAGVTWPSDKVNLAVLSRPAGQCATTWPDGEPFAKHLVYAPAGEPVQIHTDVTDPCLSFFTVRQDGGRASKTAATWQVGEEPAPAPPVVTSVRHVVGSDRYAFTATWDYNVARLAVLVQPEGSCATTWPAGEDPLAHEPVGGEVEAPGLVRPCLSFFTFNATGGASAAVVRQVVAAPAPSAPTITSVTRAPGGPFRIHATFDATRFSLVSQVDSGCITTWSDLDPSAYVLQPTWDDPTVFELYVDPSAHPDCLSFFLVNDDGVVGPGTTWPVPAAPAPPTLSITGLTLDSGYVQGVTNLDLDRFAIAVIEGAQGSCVSSFPAGEDPATYQASYYPTGTGTQVRIDMYVTHAHPCLAFFAYNADGVVGAVTKKQL